MMGVSDWNETDIYLIPKMFLRHFFQKKYLEALPRLGTCRYCDKNCSSLPTTSFSSPSNEGVSLKARFF